MASSPTVLVGSSIAPVPVAVPAKFPFIPVLIAIVLSVFVSTLGVGGAAYYLMRSGKLPLPRGGTVKAEPVLAHALVLEPLLVNLADAGGSSYLRIALTLRVVDIPEKKGAKSPEENDGDATVASVRDTTLTVLGRQTADRLLALDGKEKLKDDLRSALAQHNANLKVTDVFFTDFLVQH